MYQRAVSVHMKSYNKLVREGGLGWFPNDTAELRPAGTTRCPCSTGERWLRSQRKIVYNTYWKSRTAMTIRALVPRLSLASKEGSGGGVKGGE